MATIAGKVIGGYEIVEQVGRGAMGVVFKARQLSMDRVVALKFLPKSMSQNEKLVQRFMREARAAGKLSHPNIVAVHDVGQADGMYYISMEFIDGTTAHKMMKDKGHLPEEEVLNIGYQIASALVEAHGRGILHRDVKPDNFLIDTNGRARLADLGLARSTDAESEDEAHLTKAGAALGTPHYMSPEQARGKDVDERSDLYGLGASMYTLASGKTLFEGTTAASIMAMAIAEAHKPLKQAMPGLSPSFCNVVEKLLHKDPAKRYQNAKDLVEALEKVRAGEKIAGDTTGRKAPVAGQAKRVRAAAEPSKSGSPAVMIGVGVGAAVALLAIVLALKGGGEKPAQRSARTDETRNVSTNENRPAPAANAAPSVSPEQAAAAARQQEADKAYQEIARRHEASLSSDPAGVAEAWDGFLKAYPQARQAEQARAKGGEAREMAAKLKSEWETAAKDADGLIAAEKYKEAWEKLAGYMQAHATGPFATEAQKKLDALKDTVIGKIKEYIGKAMGAADSGEYAAARKALDELNAVTPAQLTEPAGLPQAYEKLTALETAAKEKAEALNAADRKVLDEALKKAEALVRGGETRFQFAEAQTVLREAAGQLKSTEFKVTAGSWAERYGRAGKLWEGVRANAKTKRPEAPAMGSFGKGRVTGWNDRGLLYTPENFPEQLVSWKTILPKQAVNLVVAVNTEASPVDVGYFAYAVGAWTDAVQYLGKAEGADKALADEPRALALGMLESDAQGAFQAAKEALDKKDTETVQKELKPLVAPGILADTKFAKEHAEEIAQMLKAQPAEAVANANAPKPAEGKDGAEDLKRAGWDTVVGDWKTSKPGVFAVKDGKLKADAKDGTVTLTVQAKPGAVIEVFVRTDDGSAERSRGGINFLRFTNPTLADKLTAALKESAEGYGVKIEGGKARIYEAGPLASMADEVDGGNNGGGGMGGRRGGRGGRGFDPIRNILAEAPGKAQEFDVSGDTFKIAVSASGNNLDVQVNDKAERHNQRMRDSGTIEIRISGEATVTNPTIKKQ